MARYIDAETFEKEIKSEASDSIANAVIRILDRQPTADVVEVCRCHECKYGDNGIQKQEVYTVCNRFGNGILKMSPLDYCSYGERRTDNDV